MKINLIVSIVLASLCVGCATVPVGSTPATAKFDIIKILQDNEPNVINEATITGKLVFLGLQMYDVLSSQDVIELKKMLLDCGTKALQFTGNGSAPTSDDMQSFFTSSGLAGESKYNVIVTSMMSLANKYLPQLKGDPALGVKYIQDFGQACINIATN